MASGHPSVDTAGMECKLFTELWLCFCVGFDIVPRTLWGGLGCDVGFCKALGVITKGQKARAAISALVTNIHTCDAYCLGFYVELLLSPFSQPS